MTRTLQSTPAADGFRMPGEWEPHAGTWMLWPERPDVWRLGALPVRQTFVEVVKAIATSEPVTVGVSPRQFLNARAVLPPEIRVVEIANNDIWMRDCGPSFVTNADGEVRAVDWKFNAWGGVDEGAYFPWDQDELVPQKVAEIEQVDRYAAPMILEGGSIHVDGEGTLLTTEECLLNPNRNPKMDRGQIEHVLKDYLGIEKIIWLGKGVYKDETDGHVDNLCCFIRPGVVALAWTDDKDDPQYEISAAAFERLSEATDAKGRKLEIHKLHQPSPLFITEEESSGIESVEGSITRQTGNRLAASYINFYIANSAIVMPGFGDPADEKAKAQLEALFPGRKVLQVPGREILLGGGNIHCITQQQPRGSNGS
ncbi:agmatine deiminase [Methyloligella solikamskensis]|uniref:Putative agmatine deiminase n=1 Tax=Methyloligella solikamskensis TaxID=1177756 RepID=A0ABW3JCK2_9HYPH